MNSGSSNYYQILGLEQDAPAHDIELAYRHLLGLLSDAGEDAPDLDIAVVRHAFEVLSNPQRRRLYDSLLAETSESPIIAEVLASSRQIPILDTQQLAYVLVELRSAAMEDHGSLPLNLCLVIDRSTSMEGERLKQIKRALQMLIDKVSPGDILSVVSFSDRAELILAAQPAGEHQDPMAKIQAIQASGGTEIYQGLIAGIQQIKHVNLRGHNSQLILFTDGRTYGDAHQCLRLAAREASAGITFNAFGIGSDWDDQFLDALVAPSGGSAAYIDSPKTIISVLESRLQGLGDISASQVQLQQNWPARVELLDAFRLTPYAKPLSIAENVISLGNIEGRRPLTFLLELMIEPHPIPTRIRIPLHMSAEIPGKGQHSLSEEVQLTMLNDVPPQDPPPKIVRAARLLTLYRLNERAWAEVETGAVEQAATRMRHLSTRFLEVGEQGLAQQAENEARRLSVTGKLSAEGRKQLKYGTRTLIGKTIQLEWDD